MTDMTSEVTTSRNGRGIDYRVPITGLDVESFAPRYAPVAGVVLRASCEGIDTVYTLEVTSEADQGRPPRTIYTEIGTRDCVVYPENMPVLLEHEQATALQHGAEQIRWAQNT